jgi:hypothetical protein
METVSGQFAGAQGKKGKGDYPHVVHRFPYKMPFLSLLYLNAGRRKLLENSVEVPDTEAKLI